MKKRILVLDAWTAGYMSVPDFRKVPEVTPERLAAIEGFVDFLTSEHPGCEVIYLADAARAMHLMSTEEWDQVYFNPVGSDFYRIP